MQSYDGIDSKTIDNALEGLSRRDFLRMAGGVVGGVAISSILHNSSNPSQTVESSESLSKIDNVAFIDFLPQNYTDQLVDNLADQMDGGQPSFDWQLKLKAAAGLQLEGDELMQLFMSRYSEHGLYSIARHNDLLKNFKLGTEPQVIDLFSAIQKVKPIFDQVGNKGFSIYFSADPLIEKLQEIDHPIISFASELGELEILYKNFRIEYDDEKANEILGWPNVIGGPSDISPTLEFFTPIPKYESIRYETIDGQLKAIFTMPEEYNELVSDKNGLNGYAIKKVSGSKQDEIVSDPIVGDESERKVKINADMLARNTYLVLNGAAQFIDNKDRNGNDFSNKSFEVYPAYDGDFNNSGLIELNKLAKAFPQKLFICAGGNFQDDLRLKDQYKLDNVLFVARAEGINRVGGFGGALKRPNLVDNVKGADIYVDVNNLGEGSTTATAVISAYANVLAEKGYSANQIKDLIKENTTNVQHPYTPILDKKGFYYRGHATNQIRDSIKANTTNIKHAYTPILDIKRFYYRCKYVY